MVCFGGAGAGGETLALEVGEVAVGVVLRRERREGRGGREGRSQWVSWVGRLSRGGETKRGKRTWSPSSLRNRLVGRPVEGSVWFGRVPTCTHRQMVEFGRVTGEKEKEGSVGAAGSYGNWRTLTSQLSYTCSDWCRGVNKGGR